MSLWNNEQEMRYFAISGAHLEAMKTNKKIAKEIRTSTIGADKLPDWETAIKFLENGKFYKY